MNTCGTSLMMTMKGTVMSCSHQAETFDLLVPVNSFESCQKKANPPQVVNLYMSERLTHSRCFSCWISLTHSLPSSSSPYAPVKSASNDLQKYIYLQHFGTRPSAGKIMSLLATFLFLFFYPSLSWLEEQMRKQPRQSFFCPSSCLLPVTNQENKSLLGNM